MSNEEEKVEEVQMKVEEVLGALRGKNHPMSIEDESGNRLHYNGPSVSKAKWDELGDLIARQEQKLSGGRIDGSRWISMRLDGCGFSKTMKQLRKLNVIEDGFSPVIAQVMQNVTGKLIEKFHATIGYTQSDEIIIFIPAQPIDAKTNEQKQHDRSGRAMKIATLAAGCASSNFVLELLNLASGDLTKNLSNIIQIAPHFDCRIGSWTSWEEAQALLLWRAYDSSINGVSDAVYHSKVDKRPYKKEFGRHIHDVNRIEKVHWLQRQGMLPLPSHQAYGSLFVKRLKEKEGLNPKTGEIVIVLRSIVVKRNEPIIELFMKNEIFLPNDMLGSNNEGASSI